MGQSILNLPKGFNVETVIRVDAFKLNDFISEAYGIKNFEGHLESPNDTSHEFDVTKPDTCFYEDDIDRYKKQAGCTHWELGNVIEDLCRKGLLPRGKYVVRVSW